MARVSKSNVFALDTSSILNQLTEIEQRAKAADAALINMGSGKKSKPNIAAYAEFADVLKTVTETINLLQGAMDGNLKTKSLKDATTLLDNMGVSAHEFVQIMSELTKFKITDVVDEKEALASMRSIGDRLTKLFSNKEFFKGKDLGFKLDMEVFDKKDIMAQYQALMKAVAPTIQHMSRMIADAGWEQLALDNKFAVTKDVIKEGMEDIVAEVDKKLAELEKQKTRLHNYLNDIANTRPRSNNGNITGEDLDTSFAYYLGAKDNLPAAPSIKNTKGNSAVLQYLKYGNEIKYFASAAQNNPDSDAAQFFAENRKEFEEAIQEFEQWKVANKKYLSVLKRALGDKFAKLDNQILEEKENKKQYYVKATVPNEPENVGAITKSTKDTLVKEQRALSTDLSIMFQKLIPTIEEGGAEAGAAIQKAMVEIFDKLKKAGIDASLESQISIEEGSPLLNDDAKEALRLRNDRAQNYNAIAQSIAEDYNRIQNMTAEEIAADMGQTVIDITNTILATLQQNNLSMGVDNGIYKAVEDTINSTQAEIDKLQESVAPIKQKIAAQEKAIKTVNKALTPLSPSATPKAAEDFLRYSVGLYDAYVANPNDERFAASTGKYGANIKEQLMVRIKQALDDALTQGVSQESLKDLNLEQFDFEAAQQVLIEERAAAEQQIQLLKEENENNLKMLKEKETALTLAKQRKDMVVRERAASVEEQAASSSNEENNVPKRPRGRPRKNPLPAEAAGGVAASEAVIREEGDKIVSAINQNTDKVISLLGGKSLLQQLEMASPATKDFSTANKDAAEAQLKQIYSELKAYRMSRSRGKFDPLYRESKTVAYKKAYGEAKRQGVPKDVLNAYKLNVTKKDYASSLATLQGAQDTSILQTLDTLGAAVKQLADGMQVDNSDDISRLLEAINAITEQMRVCCDNMSAMQDIKPALEPINQISNTLGEILAKVSAVLTPSSHLEVDGDTVRQLSTVINTAIKSAQTIPDYSSLPEGAGINEHGNIMDLNAVNAARQQIKTLKDDIALLQAPLTMQDGYAEFIQRAYKVLELLSSDSYIDRFNAVKTFLSPYDDYGSYNFEPLTALHDKSHSSNAYTPYDAQFMDLMSDYLGAHYKKDGYTFEKFAKAKYPVNYQSDVESQEFINKVNSLLSSYQKMVNDYNMSPEQTQQNIDNKLSELKIAEDKLAQLLAGEPPRTIEKYDIIVQNIERVVSTLDSIYTSLGDIKQDIVAARDAKDSASQAANAQKEAQQKEVLKQNLKSYFNEALKLDLTKTARGWPTQQETGGHVYSSGKVSMFLGDSGKVAMNPMTVDRLLHKEDDVIVDLHSHPFRAPSDDRSGTVANSAMSLGDIRTAGFFSSAQGIKLFGQVSGNILKLIDYTNVAVNDTFEITKKFREIEKKLPTKYPDLYSPAEESNPNYVYTIKADSIDDYYRANEISEAALRKAIAQSGYSPDDVLKTFNVADDRDLDALADLIMRTKNSMDSVKTVEERVLTTIGGKELKSKHKRIVDGSLDPITAYYGDGQHPEFKTFDVENNSKTDTLLSSVITILQSLQQSVVAIQNFVSPKELVNKRFIQEALSPNINFSKYSTRQYPNGNLSDVDASRLNIAMRVAAEERNKAYYEARDSVAELYGDDLNRNAITKIENYIQKFQTYAGLAQELIDYYDQLPPDQLDKGLNGASRNLIDEDLRLETRFLTGADFIQQYFKYLNSIYTPSQSIKPKIDQNDDYTLYATPSIEDSQPIEAYTRYLKSIFDSVGVGSNGISGSGSGGGGQPPVTNDIYQLLSSKPYATEATLSKVLTELEISQISNTLGEILAKVSALGGGEGTSAVDAQKEALKQNLKEYFNRVSEHNNKTEASGGKTTQETGASIYKSGKVSYFLAESRAVPADLAIANFIRNLQDTPVVSLHSHPWAEENGGLWANNVFSPEDISYGKVSRKLGIGLEGEISGNLLRILDISKLTVEEIGKIAQAYQTQMAPLSKLYPDLFISSPSGNITERIDDTLDGHILANQLIDNVLRESIQSVNKNPDDIFRIFDITDDKSIDALANLILEVGESAQSAMSPIERLQHILDAFGQPALDSTQLARLADGSMQPMEVLYDKYDQVPGGTIIDTANENQEINLLTSINTTLSSIQQVLSTIQTVVASPQNITRQFFDDLNGDLDIFKYTKSNYDGQDHSNYKAARIHDEYENARHQRMEAYRYANDNRKLDKNRIIDRDTVRNVELYIQAFQKYIGSIYDRIKFIQTGSDKISPSDKNRVASLTSQADNEIMRFMSEPIIKDYLHYLNQKQPSADVQSSSQSYRDILNSIVGKLESIIAEYNSRKSMPTAARNNNDGNNHHPVSNDIYQLLSSKPYATEATLSKVLTKLESGIATNNKAGSTKTTEQARQNSQKGVSLSAVRGTFNRASTIDARMQRLLAGDSSLKNTDEYAAYEKAKSAMQSKKGKYLDPTDSSKTAASRLSYATQYLATMEQTADALQKVAKRQQVLNNLANDPRSTIVPETTVVNAQNMEQELMKAAKITDAVGAKFTLGEKFGEATYEIKDATNHLNKMAIAYDKVNKRFIITQKSSKAIDPNAPSGSSERDEYGIKSAYMSRFKANAKLNASLNGVPEIKNTQAYKDYMDAYNQMLARKNDFFNYSNKTEAEKQELLNIALAAEETQKELEKLAKTQREFNDIKARGTTMRGTAGLSGAALNTELQRLAQITNAQQANFKMAKDNGQTIKTATYEVKDHTNQVHEMQMAYNSLTGEVVITETRVTQSLSRMQTVMGSLQKKLKQVLTYIASYGSIYQIFNIIRQGVTYVKEIDSALTELKKVTNATDAEYEQFLNHMSKTSAVVGSTVKDLTMMSADWARLGYSMEEAGELARSTAVLLNVSEFTDANSATEALISTIQAFGYAADDSMTVVDKLNEVGNNFAVSSDGLATALQTSASSLMAGGNDLNQAVAMIAAGNKVVQDPSVMGAALRTISLRIRGTKTELEELGEDTEGMVTTTSKLQDKIKGLTGVDILDDAGAYKDTYTILVEIGKVWDDLTDQKKAAALELLAGKNRSNALAAILTNVEDLEAAYESALQAEGSANKELETYLNSIQGKLDKFHNAVQTMWNDLISSDFIKFIVSAGTALVNFIDKIGILGTALTALAGAQIVKNFSSITSVLKTLYSQSFATGQSMLALGLAQLKTSLHTRLLNSAFVQTAVTMKIFSQEELATMTVTQLLQAGFKGLWARLQEIGAGLKTFMALNPWMWAVLGAAAAAAALIYFGNSTKRAKESLQDAQDTLSETSGELRELRGELEDTQDRIKELQSMDKLSFTDQEELKNLKRQNNELQRRIALLKLQEEQEKQIAANKFVDYMDKAASEKTQYDHSGEKPSFLKKWLDSMGGGMDAYATEDKNIDTQLAKYQEYQQAIADLERQIINDKKQGLDTSKDEKQLENLRTKVIEVSEYMTGKFTEWGESSKGIDYGISDEADEWLDYINNIQDKWAILSGGQGAVSNALTRIFDKDAFAGVSDQIREFADALPDTADEGQELEEYISGLLDKFPKLRETLEELNIPLKDVADYFLYAGDAASESSSEIDNFDKIVQGLNGLKDAYGALKTAITEYNSQGFMSLEALTALLDLSPEYLALLQMENGQLALNKEAMMAMVQAKLAEAEATVVQNAITQIASLSNKAEAQSTTWVKESAMDAIPALGEYSKTISIVGQNAIVSAGQVSAFMNAIKGAQEAGVDTSAINDVISGMNAQIAALHSLGDNLSGSFNTIMSSGSSGGGGNSDTLLDWLEHYYDTLENKLAELNAQLESKIDDTTVIKSKNTIIDKIIDLYDEKMQKLTNAEATYTARAEKLFKSFSKDIQEKIKNGSLDIQKISDSDLASDISNYYKYIKAASEARVEMEELQQSIADASKKKFDNITTGYENELGLSQAKIDAYEKQIDLVEERGEQVGTALYSAMMDEQKTRLKSLNKERNELQKVLDNEVKLGHVKVNSDTWYEMVGVINDLDEEIVDTQISIESYQNAINDLKWEAFDELIEKLDRINSQLEFLFDRFTDNESAFDDDGSWTSKGIAALGMLAQRMELAKNNADKYRKALQQLEQDYNNQLVSEKKYLEDKAKYEEALRDEIESYEGIKDAIVDLNKERIDAVENALSDELDMYKKLVDKKKELLDAEKDLYNFQKGINAKQKNITLLEKQIAALTGSSSAEDITRRIKLQAELDTARQELDDEYYEHSTELSIQAMEDEVKYREDQLDKLSRDYDKWLKDREQVINTSLNLVKDNAGIVLEQIDLVAEEYGITIAEEIRKPWEAGANAIETYRNKFTDEEMTGAIDAFKKMLDGVSSKWEETSSAAEEASKAAIAAIKKQKDETIKAQNEMLKNYEATIGSMSNVSTVTGNDSVPTYTSMGPNTGGETKPNASKDIIPKVKTLKYAGDSAEDRTLMHSSSATYAYANGETYIRFQTSHGKLLYYNIKDGEYVSGGSQGGYYKYKKGTKYYDYMYAKGTMGVPNDQTALIDELGEELVLNAGPNGRLQYLTKGTSVIPADITKKLMDLALDPTEVLERSRPHANANMSVASNIELNLNIAEVVHVDHADADMIPDLANAVKIQMDKYMKGVNNNLKKYVR